MCRKKRDKEESRGLVQNRGERLGGNEKDLSIPVFSRILYVRNPFRGLRSGRYVESQKKMGEKNAGGEQGKFRPIFVGRFIG